MYNKREYQIEHPSNDILFMCVSGYENNRLILERNEKISKADNTFPCSAYGAFHGSRLR